MDILKLFNPVYIKWSKPKQVFEQSIIKEILNLEAQLVIIYLLFLLFIFLIYSLIILI